MKIVKRVPVVRRKKFIAIENVIRFGQRNGTLDAVFIVWKL